MLWIWIILLVIAGILVYVLFAPFYLEINSPQGIYRVRFHRLAKAQLAITDNSITINIRVAGWNKQFDLLARRAKAEPVQKADTAVAPKRKRRAVPFPKIKAVIRSFKVKECYLAIDSGDVQLNGMLYPVFYLLSKRYHKPMAINFLNKNIVVLVIENNLARMIRAFIFY